MESKCCICLEPLQDGQPSVVLTAKGSDSINRISVAHPKGPIQVEAGHSVHQKCRRDFCRPKSPNQINLKNRLLARMKLLAVVPLNHDLTIRNIAFSAASLQIAMERNEDLMSYLYELKTCNIP